MTPLPPSPLPHLSLKKKQGNIAVIIHHQKHNSEGGRGGGGGGCRWRDERRGKRDGDKNKKRYN